MTFRKKDRIEADFQGAVLLGFVDRVVGGKVAMRADDGRLFKPQDARIFRSSDAPVPEGAYRAKSWGKGDRVEFDGRGGAVHGTFLSVRDTKAKVMADGGRDMYSVFVDALRPSTKPAIVHGPGPMDAWSVAGYKAVEALSEETVAFTATVHRDGKPAFHVSNDGHGGCNLVHRAAGSKASQAEFESDAKAWFAANGSERAFEAGDSWIEWYATRRPYGCTAREYVEEITAPFDAPGP